MPILTPVESRSFRGRFIQTAVTVALVVGGVTMVYPFLIMVSGAMRSPMDQSNLNLVPDYLVSQTTLNRKFLETKYNQVVWRMNRARRSREFAFVSATVPDRVVTQRVEDYQAFIKQEDIPFHWQVLGGTDDGPKRVVPKRLRTIRNQLRARYNGDIEALGRDMGAPVNRWLNIVYPPPNWLSQRYNYVSNPVGQAYRDQFAQAPVAAAWPVSLTGFFLQQVIYPGYGQDDVSPFNEAHAKAIDSYNDIRLPRRIPSPDQPTYRHEWIEFVRNSLSASFVRLEEVDNQAYRRFLRQRYSRIDDINQAWNRQFTDFDQITLPGPRQRVSGAVRSDYRDFINQQPPDQWLLVGPEYAWRDWLQTKYRSLNKLNREHEAAYASFNTVAIPLAQIELAYSREHATALRWQYAARNFINVFNEMILQGRPLLNTLVFVTLAIISSLLIMPLGAYALSRYKLPGTYRILLLLLATTAFPPMVGLIPQFLMLRHLGLLNTFIALILPVLVNGYWVFLLKGFFDSLPTELYEAGQIDGASEIRMFFQITMALSKPILAVLALNIFNASYMMFLYALIVAPAQKMWLLSVWLYQYQQHASMSSVFAAVLIASIPTLVIFLFAQRIIMRGIVIPTEK